ncbi:MAG: flavodoxin [Vallitaleaceae bacterium]|nr:flavodoxin [Vallitaleaceae bacterium]
MNLENKKCLIAYFSRKGNNYVSGKTVSLPVGNTEVIAKMIQEMIGGDLFQIETVTPYPKDYTETTEVAQEELSDNARPELTNRVENMEAYDVVFLGYPNWWGTMPMAVFSFLESYDFSEKTIVPYCTHEGSGLGHSEKDISRLCHSSKVLKGLEIRGSRVGAAKDSLAAWIGVK